MLKTFTLKNGIHVATYNLPQLKSVHFRIRAKAGAVMETASISGAAHFMEHILVQGTPSFPTAEELSGYVEGLAGTYGAHTSGLLVGFDITLPRTHLEDAARIASEVFFRPLFAEAAIKKERRAVISEIKEKTDSHWYKINQFFRKNRFCDGHPLTRDISGSIAVVEKIRRSDLVNFWEEFFVPANVYILATGGFSAEQLQVLLERHFARYKSQRPFTGFPKTSNADFLPRQVAIRHDETLQSCYLDLSFPSMNLFDSLEDRLKQSMLVTILGRLRNSRLFKLLRYQKGLVYDVNCGSGIWPGIGYGYVTSQVLPAHLEEVVGLIASELAGFTQNGPTETELSFVKNYMGNRWLMSFDHPAAIADWVEDDMLWNKTALLPEDYMKMIEGVSVEDLIETMTKYWDFAKLNLTLQGNIDSSPGNVRKFEKLLEGLK